MRITDYTDDRGRRYRVMLPKDVPDDKAETGIEVGPPDIVDVLGYPEPFATRLHNELHRRGMFDLATVRKQPGGLQGALQSALKLDINLLMAAYKEAGIVTEL